MTIAPEKLYELKEKVIEVVENLNDFILKSSDEPDEKEAWNEALSLIEYMVKASKNRIDDAVFLPLITLFRNRYKI